MTRFIIRRLLFAALVLWIISVVVFVLFYVAPGDVARNFAGKQAPPQVIALIRHRLGLDQSIIARYGNFAENLFFHFNLGYSFRNQEPVRSMLFSRLPVDASLAIGAAIVWLSMGIPIGVLAATKPRSIRDRLATAFALTGLSFPTFVLGLLLIYFLFFRLTVAGWPIFPAGGYVPLTQSPWEWFHHMLLPWFTLAFVTAATYSRLTRGSLLEVLGEDYIRTARAKGLRERRVVYRHGLRSALTPIVTLLGIDVGTLLGGAIVTEQVFGLQGIGKLAVDSVVLQDQPVIIGTVMLAAFFITFANIIVDVLYAVLDPRVRLS